jgi:peptide/nickel transport system substrate-binding protein
MKGKNMKRIFGAVSSLVLALSIAGCASADNADSDYDQSQATVTLALTAEYTALNHNTTQGNTAYNGYVNELLFNKWARFDTEFNWNWNTEAVSVEKVSDDPLVIKYTLTPENKWSDGVPVTGYDAVLQWAGISTNVNDKLSDDQFDPDSGAAQPTADQVYFDGADGNSQDIAKAPTVNPDNPQEFTVTWSKFNSDWMYSFDGTGMPAHKIGQAVLGMEDATDAAKKVAELIENPSSNKADLVKVANFWSTAYEMVQLPTDENLLVTSGPYKISNLTSEYISLQKRDDFTGGPVPKVGNVVFRFIDEYDAARQALQNGEVDIIQPDAVTVDLVEALNNTAGIEHKNFENGIFEHVDLQANPNAAISPFSAAYYNGDANRAKLVRQAFLKALPRQEILDAIIKPTNQSAEVMNSFTALASNPNYSTIVAGNGSEQYPGSDPEAAIALLKEAGYADPLAEPIRVTITYIKDKPARVQAFQLIAEAAAKAGFNVIDEGVPNAESGAAYSSGKYDILMFAWALDSPSFGSSKATYVSDGQNNFTKFTNEEENELWNQITVTDDVAKQVELVTQAEKILWENGYGAPIYQFAGYLAWNSRVKNVDCLAIMPGFTYNYYDWEVGESSASS